jgi:hypothetical protein
MTKPTSSAFPTTLDSSSTLFGDPVDATVLTLNTTINDSVTSFIVNEGIAGINLPTFFTFATGEIVYAEAKDDGTKTFSSVTRGSVPQSHLAGETMKQGLVSDYIKQIKSALIAIETKVGVNDSAVTSTVDYFNLHHTHTGGADGAGLTIAPSDISPQGATSTLDADLLDGQHGSYYGAATAVVNSLMQELPIMAGIAPLSGYEGAKIELIESGGAGTAKPVIPQLNFSGSADQGRMWVFRVKDTPAATITLKFLYRMSDANTSDNVVVGCQLACVSSGDASVQNKVFATTNTNTITVPDTANTSAEGTITITNKDGIAKDDWVCLFFYRTTGTAVGNMLVNNVSLFYS